jgi:Glycosyltransferase family 92
MPVSVSLTANACDDAENKLKIIDNHPPNGVKKRFGVCCKSLTYGDRKTVIRFIEWVHLLRILGADKITLFNRHVHPELFKIMNYFQDKGYIEFSPFLEPSGVSTSLQASPQTYMLEMMQHTDCFYRTRHLYDYIAVMDIDEVIIPMKTEDYTWHDLVKNFDLSQGYVSFFSKNRIMPNLGKLLHADIPDYHYMLQHTEV